MHEDYVAIGGHGLDEQVNDIESLLGTDLLAPTIWEELEQVSKRKRLKNLDRFYTNKEIVLQAIEITIKDKKTKSAEYIRNHKEEIADKIIYEIKTNTYYVRGYIDVKLDKKHKSDKQRIAKIYTLYDRCVQNVILLIIGPRLERSVPRINYSNIKDRGIFCNNKTYCMLNQIRTSCIKYPNDWAYITDIKKFYESVNYKILLGVLFKIIYDKTTRILLYKILKAADCLPIGSCLSPIFADILLMEFDNIIMQKFKPDFYAAFGDNRIFFGSKQLLYKIKDFQISFYAGRYNLNVKPDYQFVRVNNGFRFCKTLYYRGFTRIRSELKRRAIKSYPNNFSSYKGILLKTDSKNLLNIIMGNNTNTPIEINTKDLPKDEEILQSPEYQIQVMPFKGDKTNLEPFIDKKIAITATHPYKSTKKAGTIYFKIQFIAKNTVGKPQLYKTNTGCFEICQAIKKWWVDGNYTISYPQYVTVGKENTSYYFKEYHITNDQACKQITYDLNIDIDKL